MHELSAYERILLLTEGQLGVFTSKTAASLLRYRGEQVVGVVDSRAAGRDVRELIPWAPACPIVADIDAARDFAPQALFIGIAPIGGGLPPEMRAHVQKALTGGMDVVSGLHTPLGADEKFREAAGRGGGRIFDIRLPPTDRRVASGRARKTRCRRILTIGTDCNVGKMVAALELTRAARRRGLDARFAATGQTGIMIEGRGVAIDAVVSDFAAGAVEEMVLELGDSDVCVIEGQGSLGHPGYSGVTLSIMHGCCPDTLILVHHLGRRHCSAEPFHELPTLRQVIEASESAAALLHPARVAAVAVNCFGVEEADARKALRRIEDQLGIPAADPVGDGCKRLLEAALGD